MSVGGLLPLHRPSAWEDAPSSHGFQPLSSTPAPRVVSDHVDTDHAHCRLAVLPPTPSSVSTHLISLTELPHNTHTHALQPPTTTTPQHITPTYQDSNQPHNKAPTTDNSVVQHVSSLGDHLVSSTCPLSPHRGPSIDQPTRQHHAHHTISTRTPNTR